MYSIFNTLLSAVLLYLNFIYEIVQQLLHDLTRTAPKFTRHPNYIILVWLSKSAFVLLFACILVSCFDEKFATKTRIGIYVSFGILYVVIVIIFGVKLFLPQRMKLPNPSNYKTDDLTVTGSDKTTANNQNNTKEKPVSSLLA